SLQRNHLESTIFYVLLIKQFPHSQGDLSNMKVAKKIFGFLFTSETLRSLDKDSLKSSCVNLGTTLMKDKQSDIDANDLFVELKFLQNFMPKENIGPVEILNFLKRHDCFPNA
uniref:Uncharacterized protein n=1 Tax=Aegilops tauschii subsp. strangulata TaxID=200361 RepID=A0A452ZYY9_AEGTS